ncbi:MAG: hypothetical protein LBI64_00020 [Coriobacteriales bacterium]|jgi:hypothetical protein|nr:hypothetical protein [Coriobacteriales bacterium]
MMAEERAEMETGLRAGTAERTEIETGLRAGTAERTEMEDDEQSDEKTERKSHPAPGPRGAYPDTRSNFLTLLAAVAIIIGGYLFPTLLYPMMDQYHEVTIVLKDPTADTGDTHVFSEPVSLYPWNLYQPDECRGLLPNERSQLVDRGVPEFLLASLRDRGLTLPEAEDGEPNEAFIRERIIDSFQYLNVGDTESPDCFVLVDADVDGDEQPDLSCAVDQFGNIISLLFLAPQWDSVALSADDYPSAVSEVDGGSGADAADGEQTDAADGSTTDGDGVVDDGVATGDEETAGDETAGDETDRDAAQGNSPTKPSTRADLEYLPMDEDERLWSFAWATMHEAQEFKQPILATAFTVLDNNYQYRYGYSYRTYLLFQSGENVEAGATEADPVSESDATEGEDDEDTALFPLTPTPFATADNLLYIYDLPEEGRVIIYLDPTTKHCVGFNLVSL